MRKIALYTLFFWVVSQCLFAQKKDDTVGSETVTIVKPYTPTISDAFKVKETPTFEDEEDIQKIPVTYSIFSFPVASTFTPSKGKAADVEKAKKERIYKNYATLGFGNFTTINGELYITENLSRTDYVAGMIRHLSSQGGIDDVKLDNQFATTTAEITYGSRDKNLFWNADLGFKNQVANWYGLPLATNTFDETILSTIDEKQVYNTIFLGANMGMKDGVLNNANLQFKRFSDQFNSAENRFVLQPKTDFQILDNKFKLDALLDYVGGNFEKGYFDTQAYKYSSIIFGASPSVLLHEDNYAVQLGATIAYNTYKLDAFSESKVFVYPNIKGSFKLVGDLLVLYGGAEGGLHQNSYADFVDQNPFVSPTLAVVPTNQMFDIYGGLKGKISNAVAFNFRLALQNEENKPLFINSSYDSSNTNNLGYTFGNSFQVVYDDVKTVNAFAELKADFSKNVTFGINGSYSNFNTTNQSEAWNLPQLQIATNLDAALNEKWMAGVKVFFVGERKTTELFPLTSSFIPSTVTLDSYFDLNLQVSYKYNERLTAYLKGNNLANQTYDRWMNFPVQGIQAMIGVNYKFDF